MKKLILPLVILFLISSCSTDNESTDTSISIIGEWEIIDFQSNISGPEECEMLKQREFKSGNSLEKTYFYGNNCENTTVNNKWTYTITDGKLFTKEPNGGFNPAKDYIFNYNILQLTETTLKTELYFVDEGVDGFTPEDIESDERLIETWQKIE